jgi:hypothetical protein
VTNIFDIAPGALYPYTDTGLWMRVSAVWIDSGGAAKVVWSRADGTTAYADNTTVTSVVPAALRVADTELIMAEVNYLYRPAVGYVITGNMTLEDRMFFVPRLVDRISLCDDNKQNCKS